MSTKYRKTVILIITAADKDSAETEAAIIDPGSAKTFMVPLSTTGLDPPTHHGCHAAITDANLTLVQSKKDSLFPTSGTIYRGNNKYDHEVITKYDFGEAISDMGLTIIPEDLE